MELGGDVVSGLFWRDMGVCGEDLGEGFSVAGWGEWGGSCWVLLGFKDEVLDMEGFGRTVMLEWEDKNELS